MSHTIQTYALAAERLQPVREADYAACEPGPNEEAPSLVALADGITERLAKAEALTRLRQSDDVPDTSLPNAAWAIADLISEARELYARQWELVRSRIRRNAGGKDE